MFQQSDDINCIYVSFLIIIIVRCLIIFNVDKKNDNPGGAMISEFAFKAALRRLEPICNWIIYRDVQPDSSVSALNANVCLVGKMQT